jgi:hypothetical protein
MNALAILAGLSLWPLLLELLSVSLCLCGKMLLPGDAQ